MGGKESVEGVGVVGRDWAGDAARGVDELLVSWCIGERVEDRSR